MTRAHTLQRRIGNLIVATVCACGPPLAAADTQDDRINALEQSLARSARVIEALTARLTELERAWGRPPASVAAAPTSSRGDQTSAIAALQRDVNQIVDALGKSSAEPGTLMHGFVDVGAGWSSARDPGRERGFSAGSLDIYLTPQIGERVKSLVEMVVETDERGSAIDLERIQIGYTINDALTLWAGRFHTPFGAWNTTYHHGANLQTSISRPHVIDFEDRGGLVPAHSVGLWATGRARLGSGRLSYDAYLANGPSIVDRRLDPGVVTDRNSDKMVGFNLGYQASQGLSGLKIGAHGFQSDVGQYSPGDALRGTTRMRVLGGYVTYDARDWEVIGEFYGFHNRDAGGGLARRSNAGFVQVGHSFAAWTPYVRYERASLDAQDNYFRSLRSARPYRYAVAGARYALDANSSLKLELRSTRDAAFVQLDDAGAPIDIDAASYRRAQFQYSIAF